MKKIIFVVVSLMASSVFANELTIENMSGRDVNIGSYRGIPLPSICESTGYGFCWEEAFVKFKPISYKYTGIEGSVVLDLAAQKKTVYLQVDGSQRPIELLGSCADYNEESLSYMYQLDKEVKFSDIQWQGLCLKNASGKIIID